MLLMMNPPQHFSPSCVAGKNPAAYRYRFVQACILLYTIICGGSTASPMLVSQTRGKWLKKRKMLVFVLEFIKAAEHFVISSGSKDHNTGLITTRNRWWFFCRHAGSIDARNTAQEGIEVGERPLLHNGGTATPRRKQCLNEKQSNVKDHSNNLLLMSPHVSN